VPAVAAAKGFKQYCSSLPNRMVVDCDYFSISVIADNKMFAPGATVGVP
jgi:hypothetical protein